MVLLFENGFSGRGQFLQSFCRSTREYVISLVASPLVIWQIHLCSCKSFAKIVPIQKNYSGSRHYVTNRDNSQDSFYKNDLKSALTISFSAPIRHIIPKMRPEILVESSFQKNVQSTIRQSLLKTLNIGFEKSNQEFVWHQDTKMLIKDRTKQITLQVLYWNHATSRGR